MQKSASMVMPAAGTPDLLRQITVVGAYIVMLVVNGLANILPINGQTTAQVSDSFDVYFVPAGYVFSIWGVIYLALLAFVVYQALPAQREDPVLRRIGWLFVLSCAINTAWLFLWHYELIPLTLLFMLGLLGTLIAIYARLRVGLAPVSTAKQWLVHLPFSIYLGWITVATIANATDFLYYLGWDGWGIGAQTWTVIMLGATVVIAGVMACRDVAYLLVLVWALVGIMVKQSDGDAPVVAVSAGAAAAIVFIMAAASLLARVMGKSFNSART